MSEVIFLSIASPIANIDMYGKQGKATETIHCQTVASVQLVVPMSLCRRVYLQLVCVAVAVATTTVTW